MIQNAASLVWSPEKKVLQQVQTDVQAVLPVEPYDREDSMVLEMSVADSASI